MRAVNVGGKNRIAMAELRGLVSDLGFSGAKTLLQSGNLVFRTDAASQAELETLLEAETERRLGVRTDYVLRATEDWRGIVDANPFPAEAGDDPSHLLVMPLKAPPKPDEVVALQSSIKGREVVRAGAGHVYLVYPDGIGRSKLTADRIEKALGTRGTARNWNTVLKLLALIESA